METLLHRYKLTFKQRRWLDEYYRTGNATEASMIAYNCKNRSVGSAIGQQNLTKLSFDDILDGVGLTDLKLSKKINDKLEAKRAVVIKDKVAMFDDHPAQLKAVELAFRLKGRLKGDEEVSNGVPLNIQINVGSSFTPKNVDVKVNQEVTREDSSPKDRGDASVATGGYTPGPTQV